MRLEAARTALDGLLDVLYPARCLICEAWDTPIVCADCIRGFIPVPEPVCAICGHPDDPLGAPCRVCAAAEAAWGGWAIGRIRAAAVYLGPLRHGIHRLKYGRVEALGEPLGALLANRMVADGLLDEVPDVVIPVPLAPEKERRRGFNQATLLAAPLADALGVPLLDKAASRVASGQAQVRLSPEARRRAVLGEFFAIPDPTLIADRRVLLVDDVFTTGATVNALALCLLASGASTVQVAALAAGG
jgi:ComF family protein